jgi:hypothetical protein
MRNSQRQSEGTAAWVCCVQSLPQEKNIYWKVEGPWCTKKGLKVREPRKCCQPSLQAEASSILFRKDGRKWTLVKVAMAFYVGPTFSSFWNNKKCFHLLGTHISLYCLESY